MSAVYVPGACIEKAIVFDQKPPEKCNLVAKSGTNKKESCSPNAPKKTVKSIGRGFWLSDCSARLFSEYIVELE